MGKSTVAAALALVAARRGKRVLVAEVNAQERVAPLLGAPPAGPVARPAVPGISTVNVDPQHALEEYGLMVLRYRAVYHAVFENRLVKFFLRVIPSLPETLMLGRSSTRRAPGTATARAGTSWWWTRPPPAMRCSSSGSRLRFSTRSRAAPCGATRSGCRLC